jgi:hypothetical protein
MAIASEPKELSTINNRDAFMMYLLLIFQI